MKTIWNVVCVMAIANLLALAGLVMYLKATDRLDGERAGKIRAMLRETVSEEKARLAVDEAARLDAERAAAEAEKAKTVPIRASDRLDLKLELSEIDRQRVLAAQREVEDLKRGLARERDQLDRDRAAFEADVAGFEATRVRLAEIEGSAQFKKSVAALNELAPKQGVAVLLELLGSPDPALFNESGAERVTTYLNALKADARHALFGEMAKSNPRLAADLLERLRTRGLVVGAATNATPPG